MKTNRAKQRLLDIQNKINAMNEIKPRREIKSWMPTASEMSGLIDFYHSENRAVYSGD